MMDNSKEPSKYVLKIADLTPSTVSMTRAAQYIKELAKLMGNEHSVHLNRVFEASLNFESLVDADSSDKVSNRIENPNTTAESKKAFEALQKCLHEDKTSATLSLNGTNILSIDGSAYQPDQTEEYPTEHCAIRGELIQIGGRDSSVPFDLIEQGSGNKIHGNIDKSLAKSLAKHLFALVEVSGQGNWEYNPSKNTWKLCNFEVKEFNTLDVHNHLDAIDTLYKNSNSEGIDPLETLKEIRSDD